MSDYFVDRKGYCITIETSLVVCRLTSEAKLDAISDEYVRDHLRVCHHLAARNAPWVKLVDMRETCFLLNDGNVERLVNLQRMARDHGMVAAAYVMGHEQLPEHAVRASQTIQLATGLAHTSFYDTAEARDWLILQVAGASARK